MTEADQQAADTDSGYPRLEQQIDWYDGRSRRAQLLYKGSRISSLMLTASIPLLAPRGMDGTLIAVIGALVLVIEGIQQINQWQLNWITYRATCESLRHEKFAYLGRAGNYRDMDDTEAHRALVDRVESMVSSEHSKWFSRQEKIAQQASRKRT
jgi:hypothetical protein